MMSTHPYRGGENELVALHRRDFDGEPIMRPSRVVFLREIAAAIFFFDGAASRVELREIFESRTIQILVCDNSRTSDQIAAFLRDVKPATIHFDITVDRCLDC